MNRKDLFLSWGKLNGLSTEFITLYNISNTVFSHAFSSNIKHFMSPLFGPVFYKQLLLLWKTMHGFYLRYSSHYAKFLSTEAKNISFGLVNIWLCRSKNHQSPAAVCHVLNLEQALAYQICKYLYPHWLSKLLGSAEMIGLF